MRDAVAAQAVTRAVPLSSAERARRYRAKKKAEAAASRSVPVDEEQIVTLARRKIEQNED